LGVSMPSSARQTLISFLII